MKLNVLRLGLKIQAIYWIHLQLVMLALLMEQIPTIPKQELKISMKESALTHCQEIHEYVTLKMLK